MNLLKDITIIDFTRLLPGPLATHLLAQMGAEVIKIESPKRPDYARSLGKKVDEESTLFFHTLNHNKQEVIVDYNSDEGKIKLLEIIKNADALIEQFRPGAMDAWGLGYEQVKKINPNIVYVSLTGYGQNGVSRMEAGHDLNYLAQSGLLSLLKDDTGKPVVPGFQLADVGSGSYMAIIACLGALLKKANTGEGGYMDVSMTDGVLPLLTIPLSMHHSGLDHRKANFINGKTMVNYAMYECADGKWLAVGALEIKFWNNICELVGKPDWKRSNLPDLSVSVFPKKEVENLFKTKASKEWMELFSGKDVCVTPVLEIEELETNEHHISRKIIETFETPTGMKLKTIALPIKNMAY